MSLEDQKAVPAPGSDPSSAGVPVSQTTAGGNPPPADVTGHPPEQKALATSSGSGRKPPPPPPPPDDEDEEDEGMLRMSFLEHLEELRTRIIRMMWGLGIAFFVCVIFANDLWRFVSEPATVALKDLGFQPYLWQHTPMETFSTVWVKLPLLASIFIASPWILYQVWAFIAPGLYKRERRWAAPFVVITSGLFIIGGVFAYFVAFRYGLEFLLGIGRGINIAPVVSITEYFDLFVNVMLGVGLVFEMPVLIFFLTLLRIASPSFLLNHSRYAILAIVIIAAIVTPTPDVFNLMLFAVPMCMLFFLGVFAGYILTLHREKRKFPWRKVLTWTFGILLISAAATAIVIWIYHLRVIPHWPFLVR
jgi:sec-independent protein translocase protein TatC